MSNVIAHSQNNAKVGNTVFNSVRVFVSLSVTKISHEAPVES